MVLVHITDRDYIVSFHTAFRSGLGVATFGIEYSRISKMAPRNSRIESRETGYGRNFLADNGS